MISFEVSTDMIGLFLPAGLKDLKETVILSSLPIPSFFLKVSIKYHWEPLDAPGSFQNSCAGMKREGTWHYTSLPGLGLVLVRMSIAEWLIDIRRVDKHLILWM